MKVLQVLVFLSVGAFLVYGRAADSGKRLIKTSEGDPGKWMTIEEIIELKRQKITFIDVTDSKLGPIRPTNLDVTAIPTTLRFNATVQDVINNVNTPRIREFIEHFSSYRNRYYNAQTGRDSQLWLLEQVKGLLATYNRESSVVEVDHGFMQKSIIARIVGSDPVLGNEVVILGGHLDSLSFGGANAVAPGADDNASGSVVVLETLRTILEAGVLLNRTIDFHFYAAEEVGLVGSQVIAERYKQENVNVVGMLNLDVVGYYVNEINEIAIYTDYANADLIQFIRLLTDGYLTYGRRDVRCGYGCSDHASWNRMGYPAVFAGEAIDNPHMHTSQDTIDKVGFVQVGEFAKLAISFAIELGEPKNP